MNNYSIADVSGITKISQHTLRYYEKVGLLSRVERNRNGHRAYSENDINLINFISCLRSTGMPIKEIKKYLDFLNMGESTVEKRKKILKDHLDFVKKQIKDLEKYSKVLEHKIENYEKIESEL